MSYSEFLKKSIKESGLSLEEISMRCDNRGVSATKSYLSKLQNGNQKPASSKLHSALAEILDIDLEELEFEAYMEEAPSTITEMLDQLSLYFKTVITNYIKKLVPRHKKKEFYESAEKVFTPFNLYKSIKNGELMKLETLNDAILVKDESGQNGAQILLTKLAVTKMPDDSMQPLINKNDRLEIDSAKMVLLGEIGLFLTDKDEQLVRRYYEKENGKILLVPDNKKYRTETIEKEKIKAMWRVNAIVKEI